MSKHPEFDGLADSTEEAGGLMPVAMRTLRDAAKWDRLTSGAIKAIQGHLRDRYLGWFPVELSARLDAEVRIYRKDSNVGRLVDAVLDPSRHGDELLLTAANEEAAQILREIRRLVSD